ncbi:hypothetical protein L208DRAFT_1457659 [Tricholoma matsutake]|nr:hypothetical protein L208DRAFT_1457659 [Tricholoma matsutake 945]
MMSSGFTEVATYSEFYFCKPQFWHITGHSQSQTTMASSSVHNRNPEGKNQYGAVLSACNPVLQEALRKYHQELITDNNRISELLLADYGIDMKPRTVKKCHMELGLMGSRKTMKILDPKEAEQLVLNKMDNDAARHQGPRTIQHKIAMRMGQHLPHDYIADTMHTHDAAGFIKQDPLLLNASITSQRWLGIWVVPSNCLGHIIAYLYLEAVENVGGMPLQSTTDCGSEMTQLHAIAKALHDAFHPKINGVETPAHIYVQSIHNISIEHSWLHLHLEFGDSMVIVFKKAEEDGSVMSMALAQAFVKACEGIYGKSKHI